MMATHTRRCGEKKVGASSTFAKYFGLGADSSARDAAS